MNHCGWTICPYNSEHDKDFDFAEPHCSQNKEHCELRDNPKEALKEILRVNDFDGGLYQYLEIEVEEE